MLSRLFTIVLLAVASLRVNAASLTGVIITNMEYEEALKIYRELAEKEPETYLPYVAATLNNLGILDRAQNRPEEARKVPCKREKGKTQRW